MNKKINNNRIVLVTGASGYIGGRLVPMLESRGERIRCMTRSPEYLAGRFQPSTEIVAGDVLDQASLVKALEGVEIAYYMIHSMGSKAAFEIQDRLGAQYFARAAKQCGVQRIIYLGGLGEDTNVSPHLASRQEVGDILAQEGPTTLEFRASIVIGSGSLSFEMIRSLVNKLPIMITPRWVQTLAQPIAIEDVISYMIHGLDIALDKNMIYEIGGPECITYAQLMQEYAKQVGVRRYLLSMPWLSPKLSSLWLGLVTPVYARVGKKLIDSLRNATIVRDNQALQDFPIKPQNIDRAIQRALNHEDHEMAQTRWSDALSASGKPKRWGSVRFGSRLIDRQEISINVDAKQAFAPIQRIGGNNGWYFATWIWQLRGFIDLLVGGVGLRRGRRHPFNIQTGDTLDFWRVEAFNPHRLLRLQAEMKVPGRAWLQFEVEPITGGSRITQTAIFDPLGLSGLLYWYGLYPLHWLIFRHMLQGITRQMQGTSAA